MSCRLAAEWTDDGLMDGQSLASLFRLGERKKGERKRKRKRERKEREGGRWQGEIGRELGAQ